ncbi:TPA: hypothetical protein P0E12_004988 [Vibrio harveyi]|nr:hypothetical protein [Vibrio harveyi]
MKIVFPQMPIVENVSQTKNEHLIMYDLSATQIEMRLDEGKSISFEFDFNIELRCPSKFAGIGWMTSKIFESNTDKLEGVTIASTDSGEFIQYQTMTELVISKSLHANITLPHNVCKEVIKEVELD